MKPKAVFPHIFQISISKGGVPKLGQIEVQLEESGIVGDGQRHTKYHGGSERALCIYSLERILALQEERHPIFPGAIGENLTIAGLDWEQLEPGARLSLGERVVVEITNYTTPCQHIAPYFVNEDQDRVSQKRYPGWSRLYARVINPGKLRVGDRVELLPADS
jgi:MOSC domain-containing protein YiiM